MKKLVFGFFLLLSGHVYSQHEGTKDDFDDSDYDSFIYLEEMSEQGKLSDFEVNSIVETIASLREEGFCQANEVCIDQEAVDDYIYERDIQRSEKFVHEVAYEYANSATGGALEKMREKAMETARESGARTREAIDRHGERSSHSARERMRERFSAHNGK